MTRDAVTPSAVLALTDWRRHTSARLALGRAGASLPTDEVLRFGLAHALARDAVHASLAAEALAARLAADGWETLHVRSRARDRAAYLRRPDLGRQLAEADAARLQELDAPSSDVALVIGDGLSALAVERHAPPVVTALRRELSGLALAPQLVIATQARVALADAIGALLRARVVLLMIGERPGLSSPDSLGLYLTYDPRPGRSDADRNCVSNIRNEGLSHGAAAFKAAWLAREALRRGVSGVALKDDSDVALVESAPLRPLPPSARP